MSGTIAMTRREVIIICLALHLIAFVIAVTLPDDSAYLKGFMGEVSKVLLGVLWGALMWRK